MASQSTSKFILLISVLVCSFVEYGRAQDSLVVLPLWKNGAPGFENRRAEPEQAKDWWVRNIHNPSITVFLPPKSIATGTGIVVCPGGGFRNLVFNSEGRDAAHYLTNLGVAVFVLKYRLFRMEGSPYQQDHPTQDIFRAMRLVRSRAAEFGVDSSRIGVMGFSAGGEVASWVSYGNVPSSYVSVDPIDKVKSRPAFQILIYPGPLAVPESIPSDAPPTFLLAANGDECCSEPIVKLLQMHRKEKIPVEMHLYSKGAHAFNMGSRSEFVTLKTWPQRMADWLKDEGWLTRK